jgi:adenylate kinase family enzyme
MKKIGLIGAGGCGSTTVASNIANELNIKFIRSSDFTRGILKRDGYDYEPNSFVEKFLAEKKREFELIDLRIDAEHQQDDFITDRTTLENYVYALDSIQNYSTDELNIIHCKCWVNMKRYTHLFYLPRKDNLKDNKLRTLNVFYQRNIDYLIQGVIKDWGLEVQQLPDNIEESIEIILEKIKNA